MKLVKRKWCILLFSTLLSVSTMGAEVSLSYDSILSLANQGEAAAQFKLGTMYSNGLGIRQDYRKAFEWYTKAANQGYADAQNNLGLMYSTGKGIAQNHEKAVEWYQKAANQGNAKAQAMIAVMYYEGKGVRQDKYKSKEWAGKACDNGYQLGCNVYKGFNELGF